MRAALESVRGTFELRRLRHREQAAEPPRSARAGRAGRPTLQHDARPAPGDQRDRVQADALGAP